MQVDPIKPTLNAPGTKRLTLKCDGQLSNFAFNFNLRRYNKKHKHSPSLPRNAPPVAGDIMWSRQLLRRIEDPMRKFAANEVGPGGICDLPIFPTRMLNSPNLAYYARITPIHARILELPITQNVMPACSAWPYNEAIMRTKESKRTVKTYNTVAKALIAFETLWLQAWQKSIESSKAGLQAGAYTRTHFSST